MPTLPLSGRLLIFLLFTLQTVIGCLTLLQPLGFNAAPALFRSWVPPLQGMNAPASPVVLSLNSVLNGSFQRAAEAWVVEHIAQRAAIVRTYNEALWRAFGTSYMGNRSLVRGKDGTLFEQGYILAHCGIGVATNLARVPDFARRLRTAQDWFARRGRSLIYYSAPVKTSWFPDRIPARFPCPQDKLDLVREPFLAAFHKAGVDFVDGRAALEAMRGRAPTELFPVNGIHWNWLGAAIGTDALLHMLHDRGLAVPQALSYQVNVVPHESGFDRDLADLLNLLVPKRDSPAPSLAVAPLTPRGTLRLAAVNDSFFQYLPIVLLDQGQVFRSANVFGYMTLTQWQYENGQITPLNMNASQIWQTLLDADVVVLEEVETRVGSPYALQLLDMVEAEMARERATGRH